MTDLDPIERETARRLRTALVRPIPQRVADRHLSAMRAARRRPRGWTTVLAATAALLVAGAATALPGGVDLPEIVAHPRPGNAPGARSDASVPAGITTQDHVLSPADAFEHGQTVSGIARPTDLKGREKSKQVSEAATSRSSEHRPAENPVGKSPGSGDGGKPSDTPAKATGKPENTPGNGPGGP